jgi:hypothetical protein
MNEIAMIIISLAILLLSLERVINASVRRRRLLVRLEQEQCDRSDRRFLESLLHQLTETESRSESLRRQRTRSFENGANCKY